MKRLLDNNVSVEDDGPDTGGAEEELVSVNYAVREILAD